jgi:hypothetical protein
MSEQFDWNENGVCSSRYEAAGSEGKPVLFLRVLGSSRAGPGAIVGACRISRKQQSLEAALLIPAGIRRSTAKVSRQVSRDASVAYAKHETRGEACLGCQEVVCVGRTKDWRLGEETSDVTQ